MSCPDYGGADHGDRFLNEFVEFTSNNLSPVNSASMRRR